MRRPSDVFKAVLGLLLVIWAAVNVHSISSWAQALTELVQSSPSWVILLLEIGFTASLIYVAVVFVALITGGRERRPALRDLAIAGLTAGVLVVILSFIINGAWPYVFPEIGLEDPTPRFPVLRVAMVTAILVVVSPHVTRPLRRFGWLAIAATSIASISLGYGTPTHIIGSFGIGLFSAGLLLAIVGSPQGYPDPKSVAAALSSLGVLVNALEPAPYQTWGVIRFVGRDADDEIVDVKVHGRDAVESRLVAKLWHTLWYRESGMTLGYSRLQAVEHEALITIVADRAGVRVPQLAAVGSPTSEVSLISFRGIGTALPEMDAGDLTDDLLVQIWHQVRLMQEGALSHGSLDTSAVQVGSDGPIITDFALGSLSADDSDQATDIVELLFSLAVLVEEERAVRTAIQGLGRERLVSVLPYLQVPAVSPTTRRLTEKPKDLMSSLASKVTEVTEVEMPEPVKLRRVTVRNLIMAALLLLVAWAVIPLFTSVDYAEIWAVLESADWPLLVLALIVGQSQFFPQATATMCAVQVKLPFWPLLTLQTASQFISLAIPSAAGRVAMNTAFLTKFGLTVPVALVQGSIDGFSGFLVQAAILILVLLFGDVDLGLDIDPADVPWLLILGLVALIGIGLVVAVMRIKALRDRVGPIVKEAWGALGVVLRQPSRAFGLLGSNFVYWNVLGITLWLTLQAVGSGLNYGSALFVAAGTSLLAGFMPVPGGVGVAEATMTALLVTFGVDQSTAFAVTVAYRLITFYLPALEGFFGARWLGKHGYV
ncbi:MAG TPA: flippase-like domain-containing protein [Acidimicrobiia bacterium]|nr:flippase-like domain-containing protein [Acidimicrobiia bacterium]